MNLLSTWASLVRGQPSWAGPKPWLSAGVSAGLRAALRAALSAWLRAALRAGLAALALNPGASVAVERGAAAAAAAASATQLGRLSQAFTASVAGWSRTPWSQLPGGRSPTDQAAFEQRWLQGLKVAVVPSALPVVHWRRRLDGTVLIVSAGWLVLLDQLLQAEALGEVGGGCLNGYGRLVAETLSANARGAQGRQPKPMLAWPRLPALLADGAPPPGCSDVRPAELQTRTLRTLVADGSDAAVLWLLMRQAALQYDREASAAVEPAASRSTLTAAASITDLAASASASASASAPVSAAAVISSGASLATDRRLQALLQRQGLVLPLVLPWLRANARDFFDPETARALEQ